MTNLKGINFDLDMDTLLSEIRYLFGIDLIYDDCTVKLYNIHYNNDDKFAIFAANGTDLHNVDNIDSCDFVFSFNYCKLYKLTDTVFICLAPIWSGEDTRNPIELFNKYMTYIN